MTIDAIPVTRNDLPLIITRNGGQAPAIAVVEGTVDCNPCCNDEGCPPAPTPGWGMISSSGQGSTCGADTWKATFTATNIPDGWEFVSLTHGDIACTVVSSTDATVNPVTLEFNTSDTCCEIEWTIEIQPIGKPNCEHAGANVTTTVVYCSGVTNPVDCSLLDCSSGIYTGSISMSLTPPYANLCGTHCADFNNLILDPVLGFCSWQLSAITDPHDGTGASTAGGNCSSDFSSTRSASFSVSGCDASGSASYTSSGAEISASFSGCFINGSFIADFFSSLNVNGPGPDGGFFKLCDGPGTGWTGVNIGVG